MTPTSTTSPPPATVLLPTSPPRPLPENHQLSNSEQLEAWEAQVEALVTLMGGSCLSIWKGELDKPSEALEGAKWTICDAQVKSLVKLCISPDSLWIIADCHTSREISLKLVSHFAPANTHGHIRQLMAFIDLHLQSNDLESVEAYNKEWTKLHRLLSTNKVAFTDLQNTVQILAKLPPAYSVLKQQIINERDKDLPKPEELLSLLRASAKREPTITGLAANRGPSNSKKNFVKTEGGPPYPCPVKNCGGNHWVRDCTHPNKRQSRPSSDPSPPVITASLSQVLGDAYNAGPHAWASSIKPTSSSLEYCLDSCASHHMTAGKSHLKSLIPCVPEKVGGIGGSLKAVGVGKIDMRLELPDGSSHIIEVSNVLYVPGIRSNLISVSHLVNKGYAVAFNKDAEIVASATGRLVATARGTRGIYIINGQAVETTRASASLATSGSVPLKIWHSRLIHISPNTIQNMANKGSVKGLEIAGKLEPGWWCDPCKIGSAVRVHIPRSDKRASRRLELVYTDLLFINSPSLKGRRILMTITDD